MQAVGLTKRPQNIEKMLPPDWGDGYSNVWLGVTAENQTYFDQRWKILQKIPLRSNSFHTSQRLGRCGCRKMVLCPIG
jgi:hypothetical protein